MRREIVRRETHRFLAKGSTQLVSDAARLMDQLPSGWVLHSFVFEPTNGWVATVIGPEVVSEP